MMCLNLQLHQSVVCFEGSPKGTGIITQLVLNLLYECQFSPKLSNFTNVIPNFCAKFQYSPFDQLPLKTANVAINKLSKSTCHIGRPGCNDWTARQQFPTAIGQIDYIGITWKNLRLHSQNRKVYNRLSNFL